MLTHGSVFYWKDELDAICSLVDCDTLNALLEPDTLLDTNIIYYYFEYLRNGCGDAYLADLSLCSFWQKKQEAGDDCAFRVNGARVWDAKECKTLVYILHNTIISPCLLGPRMRIVGSSTIALKVINMD
eukprot:TRINITY_DN41775_c0_g1_i1.p1 TRINITY_DN41775_c0_g1~~TRINITY_DN41775_c0_g1_i1.p1  ORF type:complete len:129 (-),score=9.89 TRINITY_DN41775_c0_g1_i1:57-443(-)